MIGRKLRIILMICLSAQLPKKLFIKLIHGYSISEKILSGKIINSRDSGKLKIRFFVR